MRSRAVRLKSSIMASIAEERRRTEREEEVCRHRLRRLRKERAVRPKGLGWIACPGRMNPAGRVSAWASAVDRMKSSIGPRPLIKAGGRASKGILSKVAG